MIHLESHLRLILSNWFETSHLGALKLDPMAGGLSGARLWRVTGAQSSYVLRRWPVGYPTYGNLQQIHGLINHVWNAGFHELPLPKRTINRHTVVEADGHLWELATWLTGDVVNHPALEQATAAMAALARFHAIAATYAGQRRGIVPGLIERAKILDDLRSGTLARLSSAVQKSPPSELRDTACLVASQIETLLPTAVTVVGESAQTAIPLQWCLRDIHVGNILFKGAQVTGMLDFGAAGEGSVAGDVARLAGSIAETGPRLLWRECLDAYQAQRQLSSEELRVVVAHDLGGTIAAGANWLRWLFIEGRTIADAATTQKRLIALVERLRSLHR